MDYQIAIDPSLGVNSDDFVAAWNKTPACRKLAAAQTATLSPTGYPIDPQLVQQGLILLSSAAGARRGPLPDLADGDGLLAPFLVRGLAFALPRDHLNRSGPVGIGTCRARSFPGLHHHFRHQIRFSQHP